MIVKQLELDLTTWGGKRKGAGRKRKTARPTVPHTRRPDVKARHPVLLTIRVRSDVPDLRQPAAWNCIVDTFRRFRGNPHLAFVHYSAQSNHLHSIAETEGTKALSRGMQTFTGMLGKSINRCFARTGPVFASRYHAHELKTPTEVRNAVEYVLLNRAKHQAAAGFTMPRGWIDDCSTAITFEGWRSRPAVPERFADFGTSPPRTWLLREGWMFAGPLDLDTIPGRTRDRARQQPLAA
jgi:hypothetical protein